jgi:hypothetical protein
MRITAIAAIAGAGIAAACAPQDTAAVNPIRSPMETACIEAVAAETGVSGLSVIGSTPSEAGTSVLVEVEGAEAPWNCVVDTDGRIADVSYTGEG